YRFRSTKSPDRGDACRLVGRCTSSIQRSTAVRSAPGRRAMTSGWMASPVEGSHRACKLIRHRFLHDLISSKLLLIVRATAGLTTVGVQRVVDGHLPLQQFVVVLVDKPKTFSNRIEAARLWRQVFGVCIGSSHDQGKPLQCGIGELVLFDDGVETA